MDRGSVRAACLVTAAVLVAAADPLSAQCAMCRRALQSPEGQQLIAAFRSGILVLLAAPFAVFALVAILAVTRLRRRQLPYAGAAGDSSDGRARWPAGPHVAVADPTRADVQITNA